MSKNLSYKHLNIANVKKDGEFYTKMANIHTKVHDKPYDINIIDWIKGVDNIDNQCDNKDLGNDHKTNTFWCSALTAFVYCKLGFIDKDIPWTIISPKQFSYYENECLKFLNCSVDPEKYIKL